jgi:hypothetical protein
MVRSNRLALKEWAVVVAALTEGRQIFLLRKGGIADVGGTFRVEHPEFSLYPTFLHQDKRYIRPDLHPTFDQSVKQAEAYGHVRIESCARVDAVIQVVDLAVLYTLETYHIWTPAYINGRYQYRPDSPLYLLLLRVNRLPQPVAFEETPAYRGCKSWVTLDFAIDTAGATPVVTDAEFEDQCRAIRETLHA